MKTLTSIVSQLLAFVLGTAVVAWTPLALFFIFKGIWGDSRWFFTGLSMLVVTFSVVLATVLYHLKTDRAVERATRNAERTIDWE